MNKAEKSLRWVVNQIPDFKPTTNEEKMLVAIKLYSEAGAEEISRLEVENAKLKEMLSRVKSGRVSKLKSENAELKSSLTHANEECLKWHERAQNLLKDSGGSISGYEKKISDLQAENAALRERLSHSLELPYMEQTVSQYGTEDTVLYYMENGKLQQECFNNKFPEQLQAKLVELKGGKQ